MTYSAYNPYSRNWTSIFLSSRQTPTRNFPSDTL